MFLNDGLHGTCTVVWLRGISGRIQKYHIQTYLYVIVINNKRQVKIWKAQVVYIC